MEKLESVEKKWTRKASVVILSIIAMLERFSYYGMRTLIILYAVDENGLGLTREASLNYFGWFTILIAILPLPTGLLTDFLFKQDKGIIIGGIISTFGYLTLLQSNLYIIAIGLVLIAFGSSLVKPNTIILIGRLFNKEEKKRDLGFIILYILINLGAFISIIVIGFIGDEHGWYYGFSLTALATIIYLILFITSKNGFSYQEKNLTKSRDFESNSDSQVLNQSNFQKKSYFKSHLLIILFALISGLFWEGYGFFNGFQLDILLQESSLILFGQPINQNFVYSIGSFMTMFTLIFALIYWYLRGVGDTIQKISIAFIVISISGILVFSIDYYSINSFLEYSLVSLLLFGLAETFISPILISYVTRLSDINLSSTMYGLFITVSFMFTELLNKIVEYSYDDHYFIAGIIMMIIGLGLLFTRKEIVKFANGIN